MRMRLFPILILAAGACDAQPVDSPAPADNAREFPRAAEAVTFAAADKVTVHGLYYQAPNPKALILLFHQAGSNKAEYATIAPRLVDAGYSALAIDQRSGDAMFGGRNETVAGLGASAGYLDAKADLVAALAWAQGKGRPVILWGSSYSSSLVLLVAAENPGKIAALLSFSPDEYLGDGNVVRGAAAKVQTPIFVTSAKDDAEIAAAKAIFDASPSPGKVRFVPQAGGVHGSSTLIAARNAAGAEENWRAVLAFLGAAAQ